MGSAGLTRPGDGSGIMRGMNTPAFLSRTPRGRQIRRWTVAPIAIVIAVLMYWFTRGDRFWPKHGCHRNADCDRPCKDAVHAVCDQPSDAQPGICRCPDREEIEAHARLRPPPPTCIDPELLRGDGEQFEWRCRGGFAAPDASTLSPPDQRGTSPP